MNCQREVHPWMQKSSVLIGLLMILTVIVNPHSLIDSLPSEYKRMIISAGLGLLFGGLGSYALGRARSWVLAGSIAHALIFYWILWKTSETIEPAMIVRITNFSENTRMVEVEAESKERLFGYFDRNVAEYKVKIESAHLSRGCLTFRIVSMKSKNPENAPEDAIVVNVERLKKIDAEIGRQKEIVSLEYNRREEGGGFSTLVYRDKERNQQPLSSPTGQCISGKVGTSDAVPPLGGLPSGTASPASHEKIKEQRKTAKTSWVYVGINFGDRWEERHFRWENDSGVPTKGDIMIATGSVNRREKYIEFNPKIGRWVNADVIGQVHPGEKVKVTAVKKVARGFYWAEISQVE